MTSRRMTMFGRLAWVAVIVLCVAPAWAQRAQRPMHKVSATATPATVAGPTLEDRVFESTSLGRQMHYRVLLPEGYNATERRYPVLYLLHGWNGDYKNWETRTNLFEYAKGLPMIIVMPDAENSWYVNSATVPQDKFEDYIIKDLIKDVDDHWRTIRSPHRRAIAGLSMGGYAAIKFALQYPDLFTFAASLSGAFNAPDELDHVTDLFNKSIYGAYGPDGSETRSANDVYKLAESANVTKLPYLYLAVGNQDKFFLEPNRKLVSLFSSKGIRYEYHEYPGAHTWRFWDEHVPAVLHLAAHYIVGSGR